MYIYLAQFIIELRGVFLKNQLVKIFLSKVDKKILDLVTLRIILNYDRKVTLAQLFIKVEKYDKILF